MRILFLIILVGLISITDLASQEADSPLFPAKEKTDQELGAFIGFGSNHLNGNLYVDCETCLFENGNKFGFSLGLIYQRELNSWFNYGLSVSYENFSIESSYIESTVQDYEAEKIIVPFKHSANLDLNTFSLFPFLNFSKLDFIFLRFGPKISFLFSENLDHIMSLESDRIITNDGRVIELNFLDEQKNVVFEDNEINEFNNIQLYANFNLGFNIALNEYNTLTPAFELGIPLTNVSDYNEGFQIMPWRILIEYRYFLSKKSK